VREREDAFLGFYGAGEHALDVAEEVMEMLQKLKANWHNLRDEIIP
jgi:hypothetical protein